MFSIIETTIVLLAIAVALPMTIAFITHEATRRRHRLPKPVAGRSNPLLRSTLVGVPTARRARI